MAALDLDSAYPCDLLTAIAQAYLREHVTGDARRAGWNAFTGALDRARLDHGADNGLMPWEGDPGKREPASAITPGAVHEVMRRLLAETVPAHQMSDTAWQALTVSRLEAFEQAELAKLSPDSTRPGCDICGRPKHAGTADRRRCENKRYRARKAQREALAASTQGTAQSTT